MAEKKTSYKDEYHRLLKKFCERVYPTMAAEDILRDDDFQAALKAGLWTPPAKPGS